MTDIEQKALALLNEVRDERGFRLNVEMQREDMAQEALCRAIEQHEALEAALREVFEEWAGSEGFIPETAPEAYLLQLTKRMADIARAALGEKQ